MGPGPDGGGWNSSLTTYQAVSLLTTKSGTALFCCAAIDAGHNAAPAPTAVAITQPANLAAVFSWSIDRTADMASSSRPPTGRLNYTGRIVGQHNAGRNRNPYRYRHRWT